ncbi:MAG: ATP-binding protein, partial [Defluviitaleaceae bacterium]|nr:ATP-binding protein [Defluviitaleaceae bacterium]
MSSQVPPRIANILLNALKGGVVPRVGLEYVTVGRALEISAILQDIDLIADGGASFRFIVGKYGSGKSFLLQTIRNYATAKGFAVVDADLSPERRFAGTKGQGLATYKELVQNLSTKSKPDGGALPLVLERWISGIMAQVKATGYSEAAPDEARFLSEAKGAEGGFASRSEGAWGRSPHLDEVERQIFAVAG